MRPRRAEELARSGLSIRSRFGDVDIPNPPTIAAATLRDPYDLILVSCKAYDLDSAADSFAPAVGPATAILPVLNGMRHLDALDARFGSGHVLGGQCLISSLLDAEGRILHVNDTHVLSYGERDGRRSDRVEKIAATMADVRFEARLSDNILQAMWDKWIFIAAFAGITCLMRASIGDIVTAGAADLASAILDECAAIAAQQGFKPSPASLERSRAILTAPGSALTASMLRDLERGGRIEGDHIIGDLLRMKKESPLLRVAYAHLKAYEARSLVRQVGNLVGNLRAE